MLDHSVSTYSALVDTANRATIILKEKCHLQKTNDKISAMNSKIEAGENKPLWNINGFSSKLNWNKWTYLWIYKVKKKNRERNYIKNKKQIIWLFPHPQCRNSKDKKNYKISQQLSLVTDDGIDIDFPETVMTMQCGTNQMMLLSLRNGNLVKAGRR